ncbi:MAG TPA: hypothetical protein DDX71_05505 [Ruminococcus sp.]|nr:hypothetical protein [Ruminococcus sp.]
MDLLTPKQHYEFEGYLVRMESNKKWFSAILFAAGIGCLMFGAGILFMGLILAALIVRGNTSKHRSVRRNNGEIKWTELEMFRSGQYRCSVVTIGALAGVRKENGVNFLRDTLGVEYACPFQQDYENARPGMQMVAIQLGTSRYVLHADVLEGELTLEETIQQQQFQPPQFQLPQQVYPDDIIQGQFAQQEQYSQQPIPIPLAMPARRGERSPNRAPMPMPMPMPAPAPKKSEMEPLITSADAYDDSDLNMLMPEDDP